MIAVSNVRLKCRRGRLYWVACVHDADDDDDDGDDDGYGGGDDGYGGGDDGYGSDDDDDDDDVLTSSPFFSGEAK